MADPIWLDSNVIIKGADGNATYLQALRGWIAAGHKLLIPPAVRHEVLFGNPLTMKGSKPVTAQQPSAATRQRREQFFKTMQIEVDMAGKQMDPSTRIGLNMQELPLGQGGAHGAISESDGLVLSQVKAGAAARGIREPVMLTGEGIVKGPYLQATNYGVRVLPIDAPAAPASPATGVAPPPRTSTPGVSKTISTNRALRMIRFSGGTIIKSVGLMAVIALIQHIADKGLIERGLKRIEPKISAAIDERIAAIANLQAKGKNAFANIVVEIFRIHHPRSPELSQLPLVRLGYVDISTEDMNYPGAMRTTKDPLTGTEEINPFVYSTSVALPLETVKLWRDYAAEWEWFESQLLKLQGQGHVNLKAQRDLLEREIVEGFGAHAKVVLGPAMWPRFKLKRA
ncbi:MAG: hypothetical protein WAW42_02350 [Candidatus Competibacteraceae bacterium]